jgi:hypothetical protein
MNLLFAKPQRVEDRKYLDWLRTQPCLFTGGREVEPVHIGTWGKGAKTDDHAIPLSYQLHRLGHQKGEISMIREHIPDWLLRECLRLYAQRIYNDWKATRP